MRRAGKIILVLVLLLIGVRLALPYLIRSQINKKLAEIPDYKGHVDEVHLALLRGAVSLDDLTVDHRLGDFALTNKDLDVDVSWKALLKRKLLADVNVE